MRKYGNYTSEGYDTKADIVIRRAPSCSGI